MDHQSDDLSTKIEFQVEKFEDGNKLAEFMSLAEPRLGPMAAGAIMASAAPPVVWPSPHQLESGPRHKFGSEIDLIVMIPINLPILRMGTRVYAH